MLVPVWRGRRLDVVSFLRFRLLGLGDLGPALARWPLGGGSLFDQPLTGGVPAPCCARGRDRSQSDSVGILPADAGGCGQPRSWGECRATPRDLRRGSARAQQARKVVKA